MSTQIIDFNNVGAVRYNDNDVQNVVFNDKLVWELLVFEKVDSEGIQKDSLYFNGQVSGYSVGRDILKYFHEIIPTPTIKENYIGNYYNSGSVENPSYTYISEDNIETLITNSKITIGSTKCYYLSDNKVDALGQEINYNSFSGLISNNYKGNVTVPATYNDLPVIKISNYGLGTLQKTQDDVPLNNVILPNSIQYIEPNTQRGSVYAQSIYFNSDILSSGSAGQPIMVANRIIVGKNVTYITEYFHYNSTSLSLQFEQDSNLKTLKRNCFGTTIFTSSVILPYGLETIGTSAFESCEFENVDDYLEIPASVTTISSTSLKLGSGSNIRFNHSNTDSITLNAPFDSKSAYNLNIYTDNETIKNYDYASDNVTPTFYHLDGTLWE